MRRANIPTMSDDEDEEGMRTHTHTHTHIHTHTHTRKGVLLILSYCTYESYLLNQRTESSLPYLQGGTEDGDDSCCEDMGRECTDRKV
jgi:hypothetical protein